MARKKAPAPESDTSTAVMSLDPDVLNAGAQADEIGYEAQLDIDAVHPSADNPRKWFDESELQSLADSLLKHGQLQNLTVRPIDGGNYELIGGERRYRAARMAGLTKIRCRVIQVDDATAIELRGIENYRRSQLNAIEEAIWFEQMLETARFNQTTLAQHLGITQSQVSNRLRLLKLPDEWQLLLIKGHLPPTHARSLIPWVDRPAILAEVMKRLTAEDGTIEEISVDALERAIWNIVNRASRSMETNSWDAPRFEVTDAVRTALDVQSVQVPWCDEPYERAFNVELWDKLQEEANAARKVAQDNDDADGGDSVNDKPDDKPPKSKDRSDLTDYRLESHFERHYAQVLAGHIKPDANAVQIFFGSLAHCDGAAFLDWLTLDRELRDPEGGWSADVSWQAIKTLTHKNVVSQIARYLQDSFSKGETDLSLEFLTRVAATFNVNPLSKWVPDAELLDLCSDAQLRELFIDHMAKPASVKKWGRERLLKEALNNWLPGYVPRLLTPEALLVTDTDASDDSDEADDEE